MITMTTQASAGVTTVQPPIYIMSTSYFNDAFKMKSESIMSNYKSERKMRNNVEITMQTISKTEFKLSGDMYIGSAITEVSTGISTGRCTILPGRCDGDEPS